MITLESTLKPASGISFQSMGLEQTGVVLSLGSGRLYSVNSTAITFLEALDGRTPVTRIADKFVEIFAVTRSQVQRELCLLAKELLSEGLIEYAELQH